MVFEKQVEQMRTALVEFGRAARAVLEALKPWVESLMRAIERAWQAISPILRRLGLLPSPARHPMTRKKIRRMLLLQARVGSYGTIRMRGSNSPYLFDPLLN